MSQAIPRFGGSGGFDSSAVTPFVARKFDFSQVQGLSERTLEIHRGLYEGYVRETNSLLPLLNAEPKESGSPVEDRLKTDGLVRRFAFEHNGMVMHELFFEPLRGKSPPPNPKGPFMRTVERSFGSFDKWQADVQRLAQTRGIGWVLSVQTGVDNRLTNVWIDEHHHGVLADWKLVLAIDLWEHAYLIDFKPTERPAYLKTLFENIDWKFVDARCV